MLRILQREEWIGIVEKIRPLRFNEQNEVLNPLCNIFNVNAVHYIFEKKGKVVLTFIALAKEKTIADPIHFFYTPLWIDKDLNDLKYITYFTEFLQLLKNSYNNISIRLAPEYWDVRPFIWNEFVVRNHYTYIKALSNLNYSGVVQRNLEKAKLLNLHFSQEALSAESMQLNLEIFSRLKARKSRMMAIGQLMHTINQSKFFKCYNCYLNEKLVASAQVFLDESAKVAYLILLNQQSSVSRTNIHTALHHYLFTSLAADNYQYVDLMGGDIKGVSAFKSSLDAKLVPHFTLTYSYKKSFIDRLVKKQLNLLRKLLSNIT